ncbi:hypothetical protein [Hellea balneolensis]|uniref:hypothetical protein n=1 Tax=Hellea balneolensis TaxID=287478 RepID=UPI0004271A4B|nr:hypothetical protein [Hellea balneolensis]
MLRSLFITSAAALILAGCTETPPITEQGEEMSKANVSVADVGLFLDGTTIDWMYPSSGARMILSFENGLAQYEWIAGARKGNVVTGIPYQSRQISDNVYLLNWVQPEKPDFITLIFDFNENVAFSSGLLGYGTERQRNLFLNGVIYSVER